MMSGKLERILSGERRWCILDGDVRKVLRLFPNESVHCVVTSPPYWSLREYKVPPLVWRGRDELGVVKNCDHQWDSEIVAKGPSQRQGHNSCRKGRSNLADQIQRGVSRGLFCEKCGAWKGKLGLEPTIDCGSHARGTPLCSGCYICHLRSIFGRMKRVLRSDGTLWVVLGDSYVNDRTWGGITGGSHTKGLHGSSEARTRYFTGLPPKSLGAIPFRFALAMQADGWVLRNVVVWEKPNCITASVKDRLTISHEYVFFFGKSSHYYYDHVAVQEPFETRPEENYPKRVKIFGRGEQGSAEARGMGSSPDRAKSGGYPPSGAGRNHRTVWRIATRPSKIPHFATYPLDLVEIPILASTSEYGVCARCGTPYRRLIGKKIPVEGRGSGNKERKLADGGRDRLNTHMGSGVPWSPVASVTVGWEKTCSCKTDGIKPAIVLDPFVGSGTTIVKALRLGRHAIGIELGSKYVGYAKDRIREAVSKL